MIVRHTRRYVYLTDTQLGGHILIYPNLYIGRWMGYWARPDFTFIHGIDSFKICELFSFSYAASQPSHSVYIEAMRCVDVTMAEVNELVRIPNDAVIAYRAGLIGTARRYRTRLVETLAKALEDYIDNTIRRLEEYVEFVITNAFPYVGEIMAEKVIGTWITANPIYESGRWYGIVCHSDVALGMINCQPPSCRRRVSEYGECKDVEEVIEGLVPPFGG